MGEVNCLLPTSTQTPDQLETEDWWCWLSLASPPTNQKNVQELVKLSSSLNHYRKTPHHPLQVRTHSFEGSSLLWLPLPARQSNKAILFYCIQNSLRFNSVSRYTEWIKHPFLPSCLRRPSLLFCNLLLKKPTPNPPGRTSNQVTWITDMKEKKYSPTIAKTQAPCRQCFSSVLLFDLGNCLAQQHISYLIPCLDMLWWWTHVSLL